MSYKKDQKEIIELKIMISEIKRMSLEELSSRVKSLHVKISQEELHILKNKDYFYKSLQGLTRQYQITYHTCNWSSVIMGKRMRQNRF